MMEESAQPFEFKDAEIPPRRRGRPATGETPKRNVRIGGIWDECVTQAEADGESMTQFVAEALTRELARRRRKAGR